MEGCVSVVGHPIAFARTLAEAFTGRFLFLVSAVYFFVKGYALNGLTYVQLPYYKTLLRVDGESYQRFYNVAMLAFAIKPLIGSLSDNVPLLGYHKRYYLVAACVLGAACAATVATLDATPDSAPAAAALFLGMMLAVATLDLLCEGKYSAVMAQRRDTGSGIVSWIWGCYMVAGAIAASVEGPLADERDPRIVVWTAAPMFLVPLVPALLGWLPETRVGAASEAPSAAELLPNGGAASPQASAPFEMAAGSSAGAAAEATTSEAIEAAAALAKTRRRVTALGLVASAAALGTVGLTLYGTTTALVAYIVPVAAVLIAGGFFALPREAAMALAFVFLKELCYVQINGPLDYFYTASPECLPDGPHFSFTWYQTFGQILSNVGGMAGVLLFQLKLSGGRYRTVFWITTAVRCFASLFDVAIILRWNVDVLHIPDQVAYLCGDGIVSAAVNMMDFMPVATLMSRTCPVGLEATTYALLAGLSNFGQSLSRSMGTFAARWAGIQTEAPNCNFDQLYLLVLVSHMCIPLLILPLSWFLVPDGTITVAPPPPPLSPPSPDAEATTPNGPAPSLPRDNASRNGGPKSGRSVGSSSRSVKSGGPGLFEDAIADDDGGGGGGGAAATGGGGGAYDTFFEEPAGGLRPAQRASRRLPSTRSTGRSLRRSFLAAPRTEGNEGAERDSVVQALRASMTLSVR